VEPILQVNHVGRRPPHQNGTIFFELRPGEVMGVIGPYNSGKGQLLAMLAGLLRPSKGEVKVLGQPVSHNNLRHIGYVPAYPGIFAEMTCRRYLEFFARSFQVGRHYLPYLVSEALHRAELEGVADRPASELTYESRVRLNIARAIVHDPSLVILNNVLDRFDTGQCRDLVRVMQSIRQSGKALVVSSPSLSELAQVCSHLCILVSDRPLACGAIQDLLPHLASLKMMQIQFLSGFGAAVRYLEKCQGVFHLSVSTHTHNLVRFLFDGQTCGFDDLLNQLKIQGCSIVSVAEDHSFLGRVNGAP